MLSFRRIEWEGSYTVVEIYLSLIITGALHAWIGFSVLSESTMHIVTDHDVSGEID